MGRVIDWRLASTIAHGVASATPAPEWHEFREVEGAVAESEALITTYTGLVPANPLPRPEAIDRAGWVTANQNSMRGVLDPVAEHIGKRLGGRLQGVMNAGAGLVLAAEVGVLSGYLAQRVLGQFEFAVSDPDGPRRGCCSSAPTSPTPRPSSKPIPPSCCAGSRCTRRPTPSSSARCRGCGDTSPLRSAS
jgi:uncharacterized protein (DUF2342 family)